MRIMIETNIAGAVEEFIKQGPREGRGNITMHNGLCHARTVPGALALNNALRESLTAFRALTDEHTISLKNFQG